VKPSGETLPRNQIRSRNVFVQSCEDGTVRARKLAQVAIGNLLRRSDPTRKMRNIMFVCNERQARYARFLEAQ
jgi:hypothetical protein